MQPRDLAVQCTTQTAPDEPGNPVSGAVGIGNSIVVHRVSAEHISVEFSPNIFRSSIRRTYGAIAAPRPPAARAVRPGEHAGSLVLVEEIKTYEAPKHGATKRLRQPRGVLHWPRDERPVRPKAAVRDEEVPGRMPVGARAMRRQAGGRGPERRAVWWPPSNAKRVNETRPFYRDSSTTWCVDTHELSRVRWSRAETAALSRTVNGHHTCERQRPSSSASIPPADSHR